MGTSLAASWPGEIRERQSPRLDFPPADRLDTRQGGGRILPGVGSKKSPPPDIRTAETPAEREVSRIIRAMPFLWLAIDDPPRRDSMRGYVERNSIALLSNFRQEKPLG